MDLNIINLYKYYFEGRVYRLESKYDTISRMFDEDIVRITYLIRYFDDYCAPFGFNLVLQKDKNES